MKRLLLLLFIAMLSFQAKADSPLTSTDFYTVYEEYSIVQEAVEAKGKITNSIMMYLSDKAYPVDVKVAVINALGWESSKKNNFKSYKEFVELRNGVRMSDASFNKVVDSDELLCLAYLLALDNYFDVTEAKFLSETAIASSRRASLSYTFRLIDALIGAQQAMEGNWCRVYQIANSVQENPTLREDFPEEANQIVFDYMNLYKSECK